MSEITALADSWLRTLYSYVRDAKPDKYGNKDNVSILVVTWVALLADSPLDKKPNSVIKRFFNRLKRDVTSTIKEYSLLCDKLVNSVVTDDLGDFTVSLHHDFASTPVFREYSRWFDTGDRKLLSFLLTFLWWGKKAEYIDPNLNPLAFRQWEQIEIDLSVLNPPENLLEDVKFILSFLPHPNPDFLSFQFGKKAVSEKAVRGLSKKLSLRYSKGLQEGFDTLPADYPVHDLLVTDEKLWNLGATDQQHASIDFSTLAFVPKDYKSVRSICMEPNSYMYYQQAIENMLDKAIRHSVFKDMIHIQDQSLNAREALLSSEDGLYDTIDLSAASDRLSNRVAQYVFPDSWSYYFQSSRTTKVRTPDGSVRELNKFAPMGSALCFPVQTLVFSAITCIARFLVSNGIHVDHYLENPNIFISEFSTDIGTRVYGDDIICPSSDTGTVISLLEALGFKVNLQKSFFGARKFRESCGTYAMHGKEVSPIMFKVKGLFSNDFKKIEGMIDLTNRLFEASYYSAASMLKRWIPRSFYVEIHPDSTKPRFPSHVLSFFPENPFRLRIKTTEAGPDRNQIGYLVKKVVVPIKEFDNEPLNRYHYARFLQLPSPKDGDKPPTGDVGKPTVRRIWIPA